MSRVLTGSPHAGPSVPLSRTDFYREEFLKQRQYLARQRPYYSERAIRDVEQAITRIIGQLEQLCGRENGDEVLSQLLRKIDVLTGLSAWSNPKKLH
ncbi:MAG: hypothetical protein KGN76_07945 [Acidobacteriota bacterium]|nr:hypothetical protein [Acidobacteriota bacterium]